MYYVNMYRRIKHFSLVQKVFLLVQFLWKAFLDFWRYSQALNTKTKNVHNNYKIESNKGFGTRLR